LLTTLRLSCKGRIEGIGLEEHNKAEHAHGYPKSDPALWPWLFSPTLAISGEAYSSFSVVK
jgi:hypothetical protein